MCRGRFISARGWHPRHMPSEPQEVISKKTIMKETEKPATRKAALCGGSGEGRTGEQGDPAGWQAGHVEKHTIQWE